MNILKWFSESNRWKHLAGGLVIGLIADSWYCAMLAGTAAAGSLEFKDWQWGGRPDIVDFLMTTAGAALGQLIRQTIF